jgi:glycosyltransferase involved in cell wall biosynthesis
MRVRILEALARAAPVVTTTVGLEGINARSGEDVMVANSSEDFASSVIELLQDQDRQQRLSANGRRLVEEKYDWQVVLKRLDKIYQELAGPRKP